VSSTNAKHRFNSLKYQIATFAMISMKDHDELLLPISEEVSGKSGELVERVKRMSAVAGKWIEKDLYTGDPGYCYRVRFVLLTDGEADIFTECLTFIKNSMQNIMVLHGYHRKGHNLMF
jgi:hypothetical protein